MSDDYYYDDYYTDCVMKNKCYWICLLRLSDVGCPAPDVHVGCLVRMYGLETKLVLFLTSNN